MHLLLFASRPAVVGHRPFRAAPLSERGVQPRRGALRAAPRTEQSLSRHALWAVPRPCPRRPLADDVPVDSSSIATNKQRAQHNSQTLRNRSPHPAPSERGRSRKPEELSRTRRVSATSERPNSPAARQDSPIQKPVQRDRYLHL